MNIRVAENVEIDAGSWLIRTFTPWSDAEVKNGEGLFECTFSFSSDTVPWNLLAIYPVAAEVDGFYQMDDHTFFRGMLSDNTTTIEISEINVNEEGDNSFLNPVLDTNSGWAQSPLPLCRSCLQIVGISGSEMIWIRK